MSSGKYRFVESEIRRAIKATQNAGLEVGRIEIKPDGSVSIVPGTPDTTKDKSMTNYNALDVWIAKNARSAEGH